MHVDILRFLIRNFESNHHAASPESDAQQMELAESPPWEPLWDARWTQEPLDCRTILEANGERLTVVRSASNKNSDSLFLEEQRLKAVSQFLPYVHLENDFSDYLTYSIPAHYSLGDLLHANEFTSDVFEEIFGKLCRLVGLLHRHHIAGLWIGPENIAVTADESVLFKSLRFPKEIQAGRSFEQYVDIDIESLVQLLEDFSLERYQRMYSLPTSLHIDSTVSQKLNNAGQILGRILGDTLNNLTMTSLTQPPLPDVHVPPSDEIRLSIQQVVRDMINGDNRTETLRRILGVRVGDKEVKARTPVEQEKLKAIRDAAAAHNFVLPEAFPFVFTQATWTNNARQSAITKFCAEFVLGTDRDTMELSLRIARALHRMRIEHNTVASNELKSEIHRDILVLEAFEQVVDHRIARTNQ